MYDSDFDPNNMPHSTNNFTQIDHNFNNNNNNNINNNNSQEIIDSNSMGMDFQNPNNWSTTNNNNNYQNFEENNINIHNTTTSDLLTLIQIPRCSFASSSTTPSISFNNNNNNNSSSPPPPPPPPPAPAGLAAFLGEINPGLNMIQDHVGPGRVGLSTLSYDPTLPYDPLFHLNLPPQPSPLLRDLMFQSLPHGYNNVPNIGHGLGHGNNTGNGNCSLFAQMEENGEGSNNNNIIMNNGMMGGYQENGEHNIMHQNNGIFEFSTGGSLDGNNKAPKNFVTERQRRLNFNDKYKTLKDLIPTTTKGDRASIVLDAISYINELKRTVGELKLLVEKRRISKERTKRLKTEENNPCDQNSQDQNNKNTNSLEIKPDPDDAFAGSQLRSSWLQRKCKDTEVDVRIVDDEVTIKLVQRKKINCLLWVSRTLDDLQLDLRHVAGGHVGDYYSYLFNSKICEGSSVYATAIANKLIEVVERQYAAASVAVGPTSSF